MMCADGVWNRAERVFAVCTILQIRLMDAALGGEGIQPALPPVLVCL